MNKKIPLETAELEVEKWLDHKRVKPKKRENLKENIEVIVDNICDGSLVLRDDYHFVQTLSFPVKNAAGEEKVKELIYKPRLMVRDINAKMKGVKANDPDGRVVSYIAALTDQPAGVISNLDTEDNSLAQQFASFFL